MELAIGVSIGAVLGLTGAGGSMFAVPLLMIGLSLPVNQAMGLALGAVAASAVWGSVQRLGRGEIAWLSALALATSGVVLAPLGRWLAQGIPSLWLLSGFSALVLVVAVRMWHQASREPVQVRELRAYHNGAQVNVEPMCILNQWGQFELRLRCLSGVLLGGCLAGLLSGFFGVGGGFVVVPLLVLLTGIPMRQAVATSLVVIAAISAAGFLMYLYQGQPLQGSLLGKLVVGGVLGMLFGSYIGRYIAGERLQKMFAVTMVLLSVGVLVLNGST